MNVCQPAMFFILGLQPLLPVHYPCFCRPRLCCWYTRTAPVKFINKTTLRVKNEAAEAASFVLPSLR
jgi:hypothetical protein